MEKEMKEVKKVNDELLEKITGGDDPSGFSRTPRKPCPFCGAFITGDEQAEHLRNYESKGSCV